MVFLPSCLLVHLIQIITGKVYHYRRNDDNFTFCLLLKIIMDLSINNLDMT